MGNLPVCPLLARSLISAFGIKEGLVSGAGEAFDLHVIHARVRRARISIALHNVCEGRSRVYLSRWTFDSVIYHIVGGESESAREKKGTLSSLWNCCLLAGRGKAASLLAVWWIGP